MIVDSNSANNISPDGIVRVGNPFGQDGEVINVFLEFKSDENYPSVHEVAEVYAVMSDHLFAVWEQGGFQGEGVDIIIIYGIYPIVVVYSVDNGMSWTGNYVTVSTVDILGSSTVIGVDFVGRSSYQIQFTTDTGINWIPQGMVNSWIKGFYFFNESLGFTFGNNGNILRTINGGGTVGIRENSNLKKR